VWLVTKFGSQRYDTADFRDGDVLLLGNENTGLPESWHARWPDTRVHLPVLGPVRSFNVGNTAAVVLTQATVVSGLADARPHAPMGERR
jgi:tRNA (cytidine/uridine-2'-O-)-methyltransferase